MNKTQKQNYIKEMTAQFQNSEAVLVTHYQGLSVKEMCEQEEDWKDKTIYKRIKKLKEDKIIDEANRQTSHY